MGTQIVTLTGQKYIIVEIVKLNFNNHTELVERVERNAKANNFEFNEVLIIQDCLAEFKPFEFCNPRPIELLGKIL